MSNIPDINIKSHLLSYCFVQLFRRKLNFRHRASKNEFVILTQPRILDNDNRSKLVQKHRGNYIEFPANFRGTHHAVAIIIIDIRQRVVSRVRERPTERMPITKRNIDNRLIYRSTRNLILPWKQHQRITQREKKNERHERYTLVYKYCDTYSK